jgi:cytochrome c-type biogenesis protein
MLLLISSFLAGVLTVAAPCILPLLPVIVGGTIIRGQDSKREISRLRPAIIALSLAASVVVFTLLLKASTSLLGVPVEVWRFVAGGIVLLLGLNFLFPNAWTKLMIRTGGEVGSNKLLNKFIKKEGYTGDVLTGAALGPVFSSCSPTYAFIVAAVLPASFAQGLAYLLAYALGLSLALLAVGYAGQKAVRKLGWFSDPHGTFRKVIAILFIITGLVVIAGWDKTAQSYILERGWYSPVENIELKLKR